MFMDTETGTTALLKAVRNNHVCNVRWLLHDNIVDSTTKEAFIEAASRGHVGVIRLFLSDGRYNSSNNEALSEALRNNHINVVRLLLSDGRFDECDETTKLLARCNDIMEEEENFPAGLRDSVSEDLPSPLQRLRLEANPPLCGDALDLYSANRCNSLNNNNTSAVLRTVDETASPDQPWRSEGQMIFVNSETSLPQWFGRGTVPFGGGDVPPLQYPEDKGDTILSINTMSEATSWSSDK